MKPTGCLLVLLGAIICEAKRREGSQPELKSTNVLSRREQVKAITSRPIIETKKRTTESEKEARAPCTESNTAKTIHTGCKTKTSNDIKDFTTLWNSTGRKDARIVGNEDLRKKRSKSNVNLTIGLALTILPLLALSLFIASLVRKHRRVYDMVTHNDKVGLDVYHSKEHDNVLLSV